MDVKTQAVMNELIAQRNHYANLVASMAGEIAERDARIEHLQLALEAKADAEKTETEPQK